MTYLIWLLLGGITLTAGDIVFKFWAEKSLPYLYITGLVIYLIGLVFLVESYKTENIATASTIFVIVNVITLALVSWFYFGEKLSYLHIAGIAVAFLSLILLTMGK